jgi:hypothetical protein
MFITETLQKPYRNLRVSDNVQALIRNRKPSTSTSIKTFYSALMEEIENTSAELIPPVNIYSLIDIQLFLMISK